MPDTAGETYNREHQMRSLSLPINSTPAFISGERPQRTANELARSTELSVGPLYKAFERAFCYTFSHGHHILPTKSVSLEASPSGTGGTIYGHIRQRPGLLRSRRTTLTPLHQCSQKLRIVPCTNIRSRKAVLQKYSGKRRGRKSKK